MRSPAAAYQAYQSALRRDLQRRLRNPADVEDVLHDVFVRVVRNRAALAAADEPLAWLRAVAKSAAIDHLRRVRKQERIASRAALEEILDPRRRSPADETLSSCLSPSLSSCLSPLVARLRAPYLDAIRYVDFEGGRQTDFAAERGLPISTVKSHLRRARRQLKAAILACCAVERDSLDNVIGLAPGACESRCC